MISFALNCLFLASERSGMQRKIWLANHKKEISKTYTSSVTYEQHRSKSAEKDIFCSASERKRVSHRNSSVIDAIWLFMSSGIVSSRGRVRLLN